MLAAVVVPVEHQLDSPLWQDAEGQESEHGVQEDGRQTLADQEELKPAALAVPLGAVEVQQWAHYRVPLCDQPVWEGPHFQSELLSVIPVIVAAHHWLQPLLV